MSVKIVDPSRDSVQVSADTLHRFFAGKSIKREDVAIAFLAKRTTMMRAMASFLVLFVLAPAALLAQVKIPGGQTFDPIEQELETETCPAGVWFDDRCRGERFWTKIVPKGEGFASAFGSRAKAPGTAGSAVLTTMESDAVVHQYHLNGIRRETASVQQGGLQGKLSSLEGKFGGRKIGHLFDYELLSRVTLTRGQTDGYASLYYEVAVPRANGDLTLYYSLFRRYGPSGSFDDTECTTTQYLSDAGLNAAPGCVTSYATPGGGTSRAQCTATEEIGAAAVSWAATGACGTGLGFIANAVATEAAATVFAVVSVESANPLVGGVAGGATYAAVAGIGGVATGAICDVAGAIAGDVAGHVTGCVTNGLPGTAQEIADIYDALDLLDDAANEWFSAPGTCMVCNEWTIEDVGGTYSDGEVDVIGERVCSDWEWVQGSDADDNGVCDRG